VDGPTFRKQSHHHGRRRGLTACSRQRRECLKGAAAAERIRDLAIAFSIVAVAVGPAGIVIAVSSLRV
jgi:hypothetical protein